MKIFFPNKFICNCTTGDEANARQTHFQLTPSHTSTPRVMNASLHGQSYTPVGRAVTAKDSNDDHVECIFSDDLTAGTNVRRAMTMNSEEVKLRIAQGDVNEKTETFR